MRKPLLIILIYSFIFSCGPKEFVSNNSNSIDSLSLIIENLRIENEKLKSDIQEQIIETEDFDHFLFKYMTDSAFQLERTIFPIKYVHWKDNYPGSEIDTTSITKNDWKHKYFYMIGFSYIPQVYDNFEMNLRPTGKRLLHFTGVETGTNAKYFFESIEDKWYLTEMENLGD